MNSRGKRAALLVALVATTFLAGMVVATFTGFVVGAIGCRIYVAAVGRVPTWHVPTDA